MSPRLFGPRRRHRVRARLDATAEYLRQETVGGAVLLAATVVALIWANVGGTYASLWGTDLTIGIGDASITEDLQHWVNDGLMALFFFVVALEVKRELVVGELRDRRAAVVPVVAALGGVALPAAIFVAIALGTGEGARGWAIPTATDIAFAVGILALLARWVPPALKLLLLTIAIVDDVIAIAIIALFYSSGISVAWLGAVAVGLLAMVAMRRAGVQRIALYVPIGAFVWVAMLESGVHATIAGVAVGLLTPTGAIGGRQVLEQLEHRLHPITSALIVPLFALANAGIALSGEMLSDAASSGIAWAIAVGLVVGKPLGIATTVLLLVRLGVGHIHESLRALHIWGMAALAGIGFTVSLFITQLAYEVPRTVDAAKLGVFAGSIVSAALGAAILIVRGRRDSLEPADAVAAEGIDEQGAHRP
jgi:Na+:H+ antiporter, NhaA family